MYVAQTSLKLPIILRLSAFHMLGLRAYATTPIQKRSFFFLSQNGEYR